MDAKTVLVICGTGVATSTLVASKVAEACTDAGIDADVRQGKVMDLVHGSADADLIVATTEVPASVSVPVVAGMPFLTGVGADAAVEEILAHLR